MTKSLDKTPKPAGALVARLGYLQQDGRIYLGLLYYLVCAHYPNIRQYLYNAILLEAPLETNILNEAAYELGYTMEKREKWFRWITANGCKHFDSLKSFTEREWGDMLSFLEPSSQTNNWFDEWKEETPQ